jgi:hypothetical protein
MATNTGSCRQLCSGLVFRETVCSIEETTTGTGEESRALTSSTIWGAELLRWTASRLRIRRQFAGNSKQQRRRSVRCTSQGASPATRCGRRQVAANCAARLCRCGDQLGHVRHKSRQARHGHREH